MSSNVTSVKGDTITIKHEGESFKGVVIHDSPLNITIRFNGSPSNHAGFKFSKKGLFGGNGTYSLWFWYTLSISPARFKDIRKAMEAGNHELT